MSEKIRKKCVKHIKKKIAKKDIIYPAPLDDLIYIGNYKCHLNALSYTVANIKTVKAIIGGIQLFSDDVVAHFIVQLNDGTYIDPTYGNLADILFNGFIEVKRYENHKDTKPFEPTKELMKMKKHIYKIIPKKLRKNTNKNKW